MAPGPRKRCPTSRTGRIARPGPDGRVVEGAAEGRPWKVKAYRKRGPFIRRLHREVLPSGVEPEARMRELLDELAPGNR